MNDPIPKPMQTPVALIIGGAGGIGSAIARRLAEMDFTIVVAQRRLATSADRGHLPDSDSLVMDITQAEQVAAGFAQLFERHGRLDLIVNAAGGAGRMNPLLRMSVEDWDEQHAVHSRGAFLVAQQAAKIMRKQRHGRIVNVASVAAESPVRPGYSAYGAAKSAMVGLTRCLNQELNQYGVQATAVCPTYVETPVWEQVDVDKSQFLKVEDVADAVAFLSRLSPRVRVEVLVLEASLARPKGSDANSTT